MVKVVKKIPNPIDQHVGSRVKMRRVLLGLSQEKLGEAIGLTFQQVQKYEKGTNRIGASRLQQISKTLNVPPAFFFEGVPVSEGLGEIIKDTTNTKGVSDFLMSAEGLQLNRAFTKIMDPKVRKRIIDLVITLSENEVEGAN